MREKRTAVDAKNESMVAAAVTITNPTEDNYGYLVDEHRLPAADNGGQAKSGEKHYYNESNEYESAEYEISIAANQSILNNNEFSEYGQAYELTPKEDDEKNLYETLVVNTAAGKLDKVKGSSASKPMADEENDQDDDHQYETFQFQNQELLFDEKNQLIARNTKESNIINSTVSTTKIRLSSEINENLQHVDNSKTDGGGVGGGGGGTDTCLNLNSPSGGVPQTLISCLDELQHGGNLISWKITGHGENLTVRVTWNHESQKTKYQINQTKHKLPTHSEFLKYDFNPKHASAAKREDNTSEAASSHHGELLSASWSSCASPKWLSVGVIGNWHELFTSSDFNRTAQRVTFK